MRAIRPRGASTTRSPPTRDSSSIAASCRAHGAGGASCPISKSVPEEQVEGLVAVLIDAGGEIQRTEQRIHAEKYARVLAGVGEARLTAALPDIPRLERKPEVGRHVEIARTAAADLPVIEESRDAEVRTQERVRTQPREAEEAAERKLQTEVGDVRLQRGAARGGEGNGVAAE